MPKPTLVKEIKTKKGKWKVYYNGDTYHTALVSRNGKLICGNTGFNTLQAAMKNIKAVQTTAV